MFFHDYIGFISISYEGKAYVIERSIYRGVDELLCDVGITSYEDTLHMKIDAHHCVLCRKLCMYNGYMWFSCL